MNAVEDAFAKLVGRHPSEQERERLYRLRDALGLADNDAFWSIVMALEHYDSFFRRYPGELAAEAARTIESARAAFAKAADHEAARVQAVLCEQVARTSVEIAKKLAERPIGMHRVTLVLAAVVAFGALCVSAGYGWAEAGTPLWAMKAGELQGNEKLLSVVLSVPAGWMVFALLIPAAVHGARFGWGAASAVAAERRERVLGWLILSLCFAGGIACAMMLAKVI